MVASQHAPDMWVAWVRVVNPLPLLVALAVLSEPWPAGWQTAWDSGCGWGAAEGPSIRKRRPSPLAAIEMQRGIVAQHRQAPETEAWRHAAPALRLAPELGGAGEGREREALLHGKASFCLNQGQVGRQTYAIPCVWAAVGCGD